SRSMSGETGSLKESARRFGCTCKTVPSAGSDPVSDACAAAGRVVANHAASMAAIRLRTWKRRMALSAPRGLAGADERRPRSLWSLVAVGLFQKPDARRRHFEIVGRPTVRRHLDPAFDEAFRAFLDDRKVQRVAGFQRGRQVASQDELVILVVREIAAAPYDLPDA